MTNTNPHAKIPPTRILAIETSCDETAVAIVSDDDKGKHVLANVVSSQVATHEQFGGVVPEVASRKHVESITWMVEQALRQASLTMNDLAAIAVTQGPGLVGSLLVGVIAAKSLALAHQLPLIGVHHIAGHIYANELVAPLEYPLLALVVSGGHTELIHIKERGHFRLIGQTRDDAAGEAYDKIARALGLPYPGGPHIDRLAQEASDSVELPRAWLESDSYDFSFSGLKSAVLALLNTAEMKGEPIDKASIAHGFQQSVIDVLVEKTLQAAESLQVKQIVLAGGVAANKGLRQTLTDRCAALSMPLLIPPLNLCTDNAAMIGAAAFLKWEQQQFDTLHMKTGAILPLETWLQP